MIQSPRRHPFTSPVKPRTKVAINGEPKENIWSSLLDSVASGKRLPEKNLLVLGGFPETQREFLEIITSDTIPRPQDRHRKKPPIANEFALGYTYQDVLDADQEDVLARLSIYTLQEPSISFAPILKPLLTSKTIPETLLLILLDWAEPWNWVRQIQDWVLLLRRVVGSLDDDAKETMEQIMKEWQEKKRGGGPGDGSGTAGSETHVVVPLGDGEWDEPLGLPLCVVCHNSDKIDILERERGWREEEFDYVLQFLRTILLKHGASLIYTSNSIPNSIPILVQASLGIHSLLKRQPLKHNVIDREKILIPPNWDSWGKIKVLRDRFDVEGVSRGWSIDIDKEPHDRDESQTNKDVIQSEDGGALSMYEAAVKDPKKASTLPGQRRASNPSLELEVLNNQDFLARQMEIIESLKIEEEQALAGKDRSTSGGAPNTLKSDAGDAIEGTRRVSEHIGPVQFNMGGIQVDAEDMLKRLKERDRDIPPEKSPTVVVSEPPQNEALANFFANLLTKRGGPNSPRTSRFESSS